MRPGFDDCCNCDSTPDCGSCDGTAQGDVVAHLPTFTAFDPGCVECNSLGGPYILEPAGDGALGWSYDPVALVWTLTACAWRYTFPTPLCNGLYPSGSSAKIYTINLFWGYTEAAPLAVGNVQSWGLTLNLGNSDIAQPETSWWVWNDANVATTINGDGTQPSCDWDLLLGGIPFPLPGGEKCPLLVPGPNTARIVSL